MHTYLAKPLSHPTEPLTIRLTQEQTAQLAEIARARGLKSAHQAALFALDVGLTLRALASMPFGSHALAPLTYGTLLAFALGPKDAARAEQLITLWGEKEE